MLLIVPPDSHAVPGTVAERCLLHIERTTDQMIRNSAVSAC